MTTQAHLYPAQPLLRRAATVAGWAAAVAVSAFFAIGWLMHEHWLSRDQAGHVGAVAFSAMLITGGFYLAVAPGLCGWYDGVLVDGSLVGTIAEAAGRPILHTGRRARFISAGYVFVGVGCVALGCVFLLAGALTAPTALDAPG